MDTKATGNPPVNPITGSADTSNPLGGLDEALKAAGETPGPAPAPGVVPPQVPPQTESVRVNAVPIAPPPPTMRERCEGLVNLADAIAFRIVCGYAKVQKIELTNDMKNSLRLSAAERSELMMLAPAALPYVEKILASSDKIGFAFFCFAYGSGILDRTKAIKEYAARTRQANKKGETRKEILKGRREKKSEPKK